MHGLQIVPPLRAPEILLVKTGLRREVHRVIENLEVHPLEVFRKWRIDNRLYGPGLGCELDDDRGSIGLPSRQFRELALDAEERGRRRIINEALETRVVDVAVECGAKDVRALPRAVPEPQLPRRGQEDRVIRVVRLHEADLNVEEVRIGNAALLKG